MNPYLLITLITSIGDLHHRLIALIINTEDKLTTYPVPRLRINGAIPLLPPYAFMEFKRIHLLF
jgi:hypothetical protein